MKKVAIISGVMLCSCFVNAQNDVDALRYSRLDFGGTARFYGTGGAFGALGGDFSVCSINPAGIALYHKSEITFTPSLYHSKTSSDYLGNNAEDDKYNFNVSNVGFVLAGHDDKNDNDWRGLAMGVGFNRNTSFHNRMMVEGTNSKSSLLDLWLGDANSHGADTASFDAFSTDLAFQTGLIRRQSSNSYYHIIPNYGEVQSKSMETSGKESEMVFTLGANYKDKVYIGGTLGFPRIHYLEESTYMESVENDTTYYLKSYSYTNDLESNGNGFNFKFGMIIKPSDWIRIGVAAHTPTYFRMTDTYSNIVTANYDYANGSYTASSPNGSYNYSLTTPMRAIGSVAFIYKTLGLVSVDYEFVDYSSARLRSPGYAFTNENKAIRNKYTGAGNLRVGAEVKLAPFSIRGGYALYGSPFKDNINTGTKTSYTFGLGYRGDGFFVDAAYVYSIASEDYYLYDPTLVSPAKNTYNTSNIMLTIGFKY